MLGFLRSLISGNRIWCLFSRFFKLILFWMHGIFVLQENSALDVLLAVFSTICTSPDRIKVSAELFLKLFLFVMLNSSTTRNLILT